jgi:hypothetical protein
MSIVERAMDGLERSRKVNSRLARCYGCFEIKTAALSSARMLHFLRPHPGYGMMRG